MQLSPDANGVVKEVVRDAAEADRAPRANEGDVVAVHVVGHVLDGTGQLRPKPFEDTRRRQQPLRFALGQGEVVSGLDMTVATMRLGERARAVCAPQYAFGEAGRPPHVPGGCKVQWEIELLNIEPKLQTTKMPLEDKLLAACQLKDRGNAYFKEYKFEPAKHFYKKCIELLDAEAAIEDTTTTVVQAYSNIAMCCLKLNQPEEALEAADCAIALDNSHVKSLYRRALALEKLGELDDAAKSAILASRLAPQNQSVRELAARLAHDRSAADAAVRKAMAATVSSPSSAATQ